MRHRPLPLAVVALPLGLAALLACLGAAPRARAAQAKESPADLQFSYAEGLYRDGLRKLAIAELDKFIQTFADDGRLGKARFYLAECRWSGKDYKGALADYEAALKDKALKNRPVALYRAGECRFRLGDARGAIPLLREFLATKLVVPDHQRFVLHATYTLARAELAERRLENALALFVKVLDDPSPANPYKPYVLLPIGDCLAALGKPTEALAHYHKLETQLQTLIEKNPKSPDLDNHRSVLRHLRTKLADLFLREEKYAEALAVFRRLSDSGPIAEEVVYGRAQALFFLKRYPEALGPALAYRQRFPKGKLLASALYIAAEAYYRTGRFAEAERTFADFLACDKQGKHPARGTAAYGRVVAAYRQGEPHAQAIAAAADFFLKHWPKSARLADVHYFRADAALWLKRFDEALAHYQRASGSGPYTEEATHQVAVCLDLLKRPKEAAEAYDRYLSHYPNGKHRQRAVERSARLWGQLKDYAKAAERYGAYVARYAKADAATAEEFLYRKGACEYEAKQYDAMYRTFKAYFEQHPGGDHRHEVLYFLALYHDQQKQQYEAAAPLYELCARIAGPLQSQARRRLAFCYYHIANARLAANKEAEADEYSAKGADVFLLLMRTAPDQLRGPSEYRWPASVFQKAGRKAEAIEVYERLLARYPEQANAETIFSLAELARTLGKPDWVRAEKYFAQFLDAFPKHAYTLRAHFGLAETLKANGASPNHAKAAEHFRKVMELAPLKLKDPEARASLALRCQLQLGRIAFDNRDYGQAREQLLRVGYLGLGDEAAEALYKAGWAVHHLKATDAAIAIWQRLVHNHAKASWTSRLAKELPALGLQIGPDGKITAHKPAEP